LCSLEFANGEMGHTACAITRPFGRIKTLQLNSIEHIIYICIVHVLRAVLFYLDRVSCYRVNSLQ